MERVEVRVRLKRPGLNVNFILGRGGGVDLTAQLHFCKYFLEYKILFLILRPLIFIQKLLEKFLFNPLTFRSYKKELFLFCRTLYIDFSSFCKRQVYLFQIFILYLLFEINPFCQSASFLQKTSILVSNRFPLPLKVWHVEKKIVGQVYSSFANNLYNGKTSILIKSS